MDARIRAFFFLTFLLLCFIPDLPGQVENQNDSPLKVGAETVFLRVGATDPMNRYVTGLKKERFKVFEDKIEQEIVHFEEKDAPISVGIILDTSPSMKESEYKESAKKAILDLLLSAKTQDEYFLITFNETTSLVKDLKQQSFFLYDDDVFPSGGNTALYDAVYLGLNNIRNYSNDSKALILVTDGEDNSSRYLPKEVREYAKELNVQIYCIGQSGDVRNGIAFIREIVKITGGQAFFPSNYNDLDYYVNLIHAGLRNQYVLGYKPTKQVHDGKWRRIKVKLEAPEKLPKLKVHAREGYYAPAN